MLPKIPRVLGVGIIWTCLFGKGGFFPHYSGTRTAMPNQQSPSSCVLRAVLPQELSQLSLAPSTTVTTTYHRGPACRQEPCCCRAPGHSEHSVLVWSTTVSLLKDQLGQTWFWFASILFKGMEASDFFVKIMDFFSTQVKIHQGSAYSVHRYLGFQHQTRAKNHCASQTALQHWRAWGNIP